MHQSSLISLLLLCCLASWGQPSFLAKQHAILANPKTAPHARADAFNSLAYEYLFTNYDSTDFYAFKGIAFSKERGFWDQVCENHSVLGYSYIYRAKHNLALQHFTRSIELAQQHKLDTCLARAYSGMGELYEDRKEYKKAYLFYAKSLALLEKRQGHPLLSDSHFDLFSALFNLKRYPEAELHYKKAIQGYSKRSDSISISLVYLHKARLLTNINKVDEAMPLLATYRRISHKNDFDGDPAAYHLTMADALAQLGQPQASFAHSDSAIAWSTEMEETKSVADGWLERARLLVKLNNKPAARQAADSALCYYRNNIHLEDLRLALSLILDMDLALGDEVSYRKHSQQYRQVAESSFVQRAKFEDEELTLMMQAEERQRSLYKAEADSRSEHWRMAFVSLVSVALLVLAIAAAVSSFKHKKRLKELEILQGELDQRNAHLQRMNDVKNKLLSIMSHELRSPLTSLQGLLNLLHAEGISQTEFVQCIPILEAEAQNSLFLLDNLLFWVKAQMQGIHLKPAIHQVLPLVEESVQLFANNAQKKAIVVHTSIAPHSTIYVDADVTKLVVRNVLNNAIKFTHDGGNISITERHYPTGLSLVIKDTGIGMAKEVVQQIQAGQLINSARGTSHEKGAGIGLHFSLDLLQQMGGSYHVQSAEGHGTSFTLLFPGTADAVKKLSPTA